MDCGEVHARSWEREIDERVYKLYGLTAEEIKIVEGEKRCMDRLTLLRASMR